MKGKKWEEKAIKKKFKINEKKVLTFSEYNARIHKLFETKRFPLKSAESKMKKVEKGHLTKAGRYGRIGKLF